MKEIYLIRNFGSQALLVVTEKGIRLVFQQEPEWLEFYKLWIYEGQK